MIETVQKIIQIGSSQGVTLSKKDLAQLGAKRGDVLKLKVELANGQDKHQKLLREYDAFVSKYGQTLKNLADK
jgi:antitoxin component of MazEF toxin-antitoxin module